MKKLLFVVVLIFCLLGTTQTAYSYFENKTITIINEEGTLYHLSEISPTTNKNLVPLDASLGLNDTHYKTYLYEVYIEAGVTIDSLIKNITMGHSTLTQEELASIFNFEITIDHIKSVQLSEGWFTNKTDGELVQITVEVTMNDVPLLVDNNNIFSNNLSFNYLLTVSKP